MPVIVVIMTLGLYLLGMGLAIHALVGIRAGTEAGPLGDIYPFWTAVHFASSLVFAVLALIQLSSRVRRRYPSVHRYSGRIAVIAGLVAAASGASIPLGVPDRPVFWRILIVAYFSITVGFLVLGYIAARRRQFERHRVWMTRAIASEIAVMTERLIFPLFPGIFGIHDEFIFWIYFSGAMTIAWGINISVAEWWLRTRKLPSLTLK